MRTILMIIVIAALLTGCSGSKKEDDLSDSQIKDAQQRVKELEGKQPR